MADSDVTMHKEFDNNNNNNSTSLFVKVSPSPTDSTLGEKPTDQNFPSNDYDKTITTYGTNNKNNHNNLSLSLPPPSPPLPLPLPSQSTSQSPAPSDAVVVSVRVDPVPPSPAVSPFHLLGSRTAFLLLCFVSGFIDCASFTSLYSLFTAHTTGNYVIATSFVANYGPDESNNYTRLILIPFFILGAFLTECTAEYITIRNQNISPNQFTIFNSISTILLGGNCILHIVLWIVGTNFRTQILNAGSTNNLYVLVVGCIAALAMGSQGAICKRLLSEFPQTNVMTGNTIMVTTSLAKLTIRDSLIHSEKKTDLHLKNEKERTKLIQGVKTTGTGICFFLVGCICGALLVHYIYWNCVSVTFAITLILTLDTIKWRK